MFCTPSTPSCHPLIAAGKKMSTFCRGNKYHPSSIPGHKVVDLTSARWLLMQIPGIERHSDGC